MSDLEQWVNVERDGKLVDGAKITSEERLGALLVKLEFASSTPGLAKFKVVPEGGKNIGYESAERSRNARFRMRGSRANALKGDGGTAYVPEQKLQLPAAGGNRYKVVARDAAGNTAESDVIVTRRRLFFHALEHAGGGTIDLAAVMRAVADVFWKDDISIDVVEHTPPTRLRGCGQGITSDYAQNDLVPRADRRLKVPDRRVGFGILIVPHLADLEEVELAIPMKLTDVADVSVDGVGWRFDEAKKRIRIGLPAELWHGLDRQEDRDQFWLVGQPSIDFATTPTTTQTLSFSRDDVRISDPKAHTHGGHSEIEIDCDPTWVDVTQHKADPATMKLRVRLATGWTCGFSIPGSSFVAIAKRVGWEDVDTNEAIKTMTHELGHRFGLAASGDVQTCRLKTWTPNHHDEYYDDDTRPTLGHAGRHCSHGITFDANGDPDPAKSPQCEMWGADYGGPPAGFCAQCRKSARKIDVSNVQR